MTNLSNRARSSMRRIERVIDRMYERKITVNENKSNISLNTKKTYTDQVKSFFREVHKKFGVSDISKVNNDHFHYVLNRRFQNFKDGKTSEAYNIRTMLAALKHFNLGIQETNFYSNSKKFKIGDVDEARQLLKDEGIYRRSKYSEVLKATTDQAQQVIENIRNKGYKTATREIAGKVSYISLKSGGRITNTLALKKRDFRRIDKKTGEITFRNDKGGLTRTVKIDDSLLSFLESETKDLRDDQYLFQDRKHDGKLKSRNQLRKDITRIISNAASEFSTTKTIIEKNKKDGTEIKREIDVKFTPHSFRKAFALERTKNYYLMLSSKDKIEKVLQDKFKDNRKMKEKYFNQLDRINRNRKTDREMTRDELAIFLTSADLGHFRIDVIRMYYCDMNDVRNHYKLK